jgi:C4-dicarboxylate transporter, DctM subunit
MKRLSDTFKSYAGQAADALGIGGRVENAVGLAAVAALALMPTIESVLRSLAGHSFYSSAEWVQHLVLWVAMVGGMVTTREGRHLALTAGLDSFEGRAGPLLRGAAAGVSVGVCAALAVSALSFVLIGFEPGRRISGIPIPLIAAILPVGFAVIATRFVLAMEARKLRPLLAAAAALLGVVFAWQPLLSCLRAVLPAARWVDALQGLLAAGLDPVLRTAGLAVLALLVGGAFLGLPLFVVLGGAAFVFFLRSGGSLEVIPNEGYTLLTGPILPAIPLFTLTGFILSESKAADRLVELFHAWLGWLRGGLVVMSIVACAFFTTFTGGSGVTILAVGGLLLAVMVKSGYPKRFAIGLLTASGSIGLLFPPSLAVIMYGVTALVSIKDLFIGGLIPGIVLVVTLSVVSLLLSRGVREERRSFDARAAWRAFGGAAWEVALPLMILVSYFSGFATLVESAALSVVYALIVEVGIRRDIRVRDVPAVVAKCLPVVGGVLMILTVAKGLSFFVVDAEIPVRLTEAVQKIVHSRYVFLLLLNLGLLITGCFMDIFSAILVVAPLVIPLGNAYGVHPVHLGMIFLANLELGYLTPPIGLNLFLASYRFEEPLGQVYREVMPFLLVSLGGVLVITYVPWLSTGLLALFGG